MKLNLQKVDEAVLAVLWLTLHDGCRVWKTIDHDDFSTYRLPHRKKFTILPSRRRA